MKGSKNVLKKITEREEKLKNAKPHDKFTIGSGNGIRSRILKVENK